MGVSREAKMEMKEMGISKMALRQFPAKRKKLKKFEQTCLLTLMAFKNQSGKFSGYSGSTQSHLSDPVSLLTGSGKHESWDME